MAPLRNNQADRRGFTLTEVMIAAAITVLVVSGVFSVFIQGMRVWERESIMGELNMDLELALERIRADLRLSSVGIGLMSFYPDDGSDFTAISLPLSDDTDNDGLLDREADGRILWNRTVIYHVRPGSPDKLLRTEFWPRNTNAVPADFYAQLEKVVAATSPAEIAAATMPGEQVRSKVVFENLVDLVFRPPEANYDCYAPVRTKGRTFNWGSVVLDGGMHTLSFTALANNPASTGFNIEVDRIRLSNSGSDREGEIYVPANTHPTSPMYTHSVSGMTVSAAQRSSGWTFSGNCAAVAASATSGSILEFDIYNDLWCDSNFDNPGSIISSNCSAKFDHSFTNVNPYIPDVVVTMDKGIAWTANSVADSEATELIAGRQLQVTNIIYGGSNVLSAINLNGKWARLQFQGGLGAPTYITNVFLVDRLTGTADAVTFNDGDAAAFVPSLGTLWSDWVPDFVINRDQDYHVAFQIGGQGDLDLDLFVGGSSGQILHHENIGTPLLPAWGGGDSSWGGVDYGSYCGVAFVDIDSDGDQDLFMGGWSVGEIQFFENQGSVAVPNMVLVDSYWKGIQHPLSRPVFADIDADGDYDFFAGGQNGYLEFVENTGTPSEPSWGPVDTSWMDLRVLRQDNPWMFNHFSAPAFADIDADGDLDLFMGRYDPGDITMFENTGTPSVPAFGVTNSPYAGLSVGLSSTPAFGDIDGDGDLDLLVGDYDGTVTLFENTGDAANAVWGVTNANYNGIDVGSWSTPVFCNINPDLNSLWKEVTASGTVAYVDGVATNTCIALAKLEVGYPETAVFRSGIFDTRMPAPQYRQLNWTHVEDFSGGGDIDIRVRSSNLADMSDLTDADWQDARFGDDGHFQGNIGNNLSSLSRKQYVQYEALFRCFKSEAHTNDATAILRDVTIDWPGPTGLVDLMVDFGKGPDCAIINATVDGRPFVKGVSLEMEIYKQGRTGLQSTMGVLEVRPLNTGK
ncbi:MAG: prepilin-type N-terminal cleavage/methylation domain-containing protein [Verrucomicrobia bacterium]|jgi:prepilin-type N-terminal cleavage/methylation domain-containing protein|nr:prepilin-type N-terminal cleavage/methylation domain-containing protein [Verrucomicrobiota bacterium]MBT7067540.1 prepilin-type N-terminal cleavage/methylation domain-containing protein [Verrucomicrobiota bacterium]MBT7698697.1 prepilin-type N-terminal cleavage/methylation domain-containing protein [Verrucomicrobiota bacterium]